eukprot:COSAG06_NODE_46209_length_348_cov_1.489960_1_plen_37_part_01
MHGLPSIRLNNCPSSAVKIYMHARRVPQIMLKVNYSV